MIPSTVRYHIYSENQTSVLVHTCTGTVLSMAVFKNYGRIQDYFTTCDNDLTQNIIDTIMLPYQYGNGTVPYRSIMMFVKNIFFGYSISISSKR